jgi:hypothetical protein
MAKFNYVGAIRKKTWEKKMSIRTKLMASAAVCAGLTVPAGVSAGEMSLTRIATMPTGAEVTGLSRTALGEIFLNAQHPGGKNTFKDGASPALLGYIDGFADGTGYSGPSMELPPESARDTVAVATGEYVTLGKAGDALGSGQVLGGVYDTSGKLMYVSNAPDFNGFVPRGANSAYLYTGWEGAGREGAGALSRLSLSRVDGKWQADLNSSRMVDLSSVDGGQVICSGVVTPWGTPLLAEEYFFYNTAVWNHPDNYDADEKPGFAGGNDKTYIKPLNMQRYLGKMANPYRYGYMIEVENAASETGETPVKHYATGRLSHEIATVMPDMRTLYMSDDDSAVYSDKVYNTASGGVFFKFVADQRGDLSSGTLYAAKLKQDAGADPHTTGFDVSWIELGHGNNAEIAGWIDDYDGVQVSDYVDGQTNYISDDEIRAYAEMQSGQDLNGDGSVASAPDARILSMKWAQWLSTAIYMVYILLLAYVFEVSEVELSETAIVDMMKVVAPILPILLVAAALAAQFSAAVADTSGSGGLIAELSGHRLTPRQAYAILTFIGISLTWSANVFEIISYASRAFAAYYAIQSVIAAISAYRRGRHLSTIAFTLLAILGAAITVLGQAVEGA